MSKEDSSISFGVGLLLGVVGGVIAAVLYAPKSGEETRKDLQKLRRRTAPRLQKADKKQKVKDSRIYELQRGITEASRKA